MFSMTAIAMEEDLEGVKDAELRAKLLDLLEDLKTYHEETKDELKDLKKPQEERAASALAQSVCDFAEWHWGGYKRDGETRAAVRDALWTKVSDDVYRISGFRPEAPRSDE